MKWNVDKLIERYYGGEAEKIFKEGGIHDPRAETVRVEYLKLGASTNARLYPEKEETAQ